MGALVLLGWMGNTTYRATDEVIHAGQSVTHTREVLENLQGLYSAISDAEAGQRGYIITGGPDFLERYTNGVALLSVHFGNLQKLVADNPLQTHRLTILKPMIDERLATLDAVVRLRADQGFEVARDQLIRDHQKRLMREISLEIKVMEKEEELLLRMRTDVATSDARDSLSLALLGTVTGVVVLGVCLFLLLREIRQRSRTEAVVQRLNLDLAEHARQLEANNRELEAFSYTVSHDLRAPLRHIQGFAGLLKDMGPGANGKSERYFALIDDAVVKMTKLVDDLLEFSRAARAPMQMAAINLGILVQDVIADLAPSYAGREVTWQVADLPVVRADPTLLRAVLANLIGNAIKYTSQKPRAGIQIAAAPSTPAEDIFFVKDNGVGFDMAEADKLFGVFVRLHSPEHFEGVGIGLAHVRRIIERHGGRVWADAQPDRGATFYFSLPKKVPVPGNAAGTPLAVAGAK